MGAVIDEKAMRGHAEALELAKQEAKVLVGGEVDDSEGFFVQPTVIETSDPDFRLMKEELFGPIVTAYVYDEAKYDDTLEVVDRTAAYALTGAVFSARAGRASTAPTRSSATRRATST